MKGCIILLVFVGSVLTQNNRDGKILGTQFWNHLERGFDNFADNLEVTLDQLSTLNQRFSDEFKSATRDMSHLSRRFLTPSKGPTMVDLDQTLPSWMEASPHNKDEDFGDKKIEVIEGELGGVDDGLTVKVFYEGDAKPQIIKKQTEQHIPSVPKRPSIPKFPFQSVFQNIFNGIFNRNNAASPNYSHYGPWWQGPNVCMDRAEIDEGSKDNKTDTTSRQSKIFTFSANTYQCDVQESKVVCLVTVNNRGIRKSLYTTYRCCHGYVKINSMCEKAEDKKMTKLMEELGATDFLQLIQGSDIEDMINSENFTIFVPTNEAVEELKEDIMSLNDPDDLKRADQNPKEEWLSDAGEAVKSLAVSGIVQLADFMNEKTLQTLKNESAIKINTYYGNPVIVTANCARVVSANQRATNGVIHTIDRINRPFDGSIMDYIKNNDQFTILQKLLKKEVANETLQILEDPGHVTLLAPTDEAFQSLPKNTLNAILDGSLCLESILKNHIAPSCFCSTAIRASSEVTTILGGKLELNRDDEENISIGDSNVIDRDLIASNGIIHTIDQVLIPDEAKPIIEILKKMELNKFVEYLEKAKMLDEITKLSDVTIFAPNDKAFEQFEKKNSNIKDDREALKKLLNYHISVSTLNDDDFYNNHFVDTRAGHPLRVNMYTTSPMLSFSNRPNPSTLTVGCRKIKNVKVKSCGSVVHPIEEVLEIPENSVEETLENDNDFSIFNQIIKDTGVVDELSKEGFYTVLAPSDHAFKTLPQHELDFILADNDTKAQIARTHILTEYLCCSGINPTNWLFMDHKRTLEGDSIHIRRNHQGRLKAGPARITHCGNPTKNGIVHTLNQLVYDFAPEGSRNETQSFPKIEHVFEYPTIEFVLKI